jgi:hypothetical protein
MPASRESFAELRAKRVYLRDSSQYGVASQVDQQLERMCKQVSEIGQPGTKIMNYQMRSSTRPVLDLDSSTLTLIKEPHTVLQMYAALEVVILTYSRVWRIEDKLGTW